MPYEAMDGWLRRNGGPADIEPSFVGGYPGDVEDHALIGQHLRQAFAFFRVHADRRYSASSLLKLLQEADRIDNARNQGIVATDLPYTLSVNLPYEYDEETEVKSGGTLAMAVIFPGGRTMLAVNGGMRRNKLGASCVGFIDAYFGMDTQLWIHQQNIPGQQFALSRQMLPREVNRTGAVLYARHARTEEPCEAVAEEYPEVIDDLARRHNRSQRRPMPRRPRPAPLYDEDYPEEDCDPYEFMDEPDYDPEESYAPAPAITRAVRAGRSVDVGQFRVTLDRTNEQALMDWVWSEADREATPENING